MGSLTEGTAPSGDKNRVSLSGFLQKLRKRRIIETLAAFIGGGWLLLEFVHWILVDHYHFPEKIIDITFVAILGALVCTLTWRWFSGREVPRKFKLERVLIPLILVMTVVLDISLLIHLKSPESETIPPPKWKNSIAVLPFKDMSPQKDQDWFCDGITDEIIGRLSNISELKVPARTSVFFFKGKDQDIKEIGKALGVSTVLEGSIQKVESKFRARVQLINIADGYHLWSEVYDRELKDVFALQDEIALAVVDKLKLTLLGEEKERLRKSRAINPTAYEEYLKGIYSWWQWSEEGVKNAILHFSRAIEIEPEYAPAHAGMALAYITGSGWLQIWPPREGVPKGKEIAQRAILLDPTLAEGYVAMGQARMNYDWDWTGGEKDIKRALELNPNSTLALDAYSGLLAIRGRIVQAVAVQNRALELDPLSPGLWHDLGFPYWMAGELDRAIPPLRKALELDRYFHQTRMLLAYSYQLTGKFAEAAAEFETLAQLAPDLPLAIGSLGYYYGVTNRPAEARKVLARLDQLAHERYVPPWARAITYIGLGQKSLALDWLERAFEEHDGWMWTINGDPWFVTLRNEPRFQALVKRVGSGN